MMDIVNFAHGEFLMIECIDLLGQASFSTSILLSHSLLSAIVGMFLDWHPITVW